MHWLLFALAAAACPAHTDFLVRSDPTLAPVRPYDCASVSQSPPEFTWPPQNGKNAYTLSLTVPDGHSESRSTVRNFLLWDRVLPAGDYSWQLEVSGDNREKSAARRFTIARDAVPFVVPAFGAMLAQARATRRPRTFAQDPSGRDNRALLAEVDGSISKALIAEPRSSSVGGNYDESVNAQKRALAAAYAWAATRDPRYGSEAVRHLVAQAQWDPAGPTGYRANDMANRTVAWTLALGYDWVSDRLDAPQKAAVLRSIRARTQPMFEDILPRVSSYPYDSHGNVTLNIVAAIGVLMAGDIPEADAWLREAVPAAVAWTSPWGWQDGGFANGTEQMFWDTGSNLLAWVVMRNAAGLDLAKKEWVRNHARFMAYFVPPGAPSGNFGDGQELATPELWARISKGFTRFAPTPIGRWYAAQGSGEDTSRMELLLAPKGDGERAPFPTGTPNSAWFPSVGWAAMHSDLADPLRTSVFFKSSPYGSYNHSHADQNSFVVNDKGRRLAIASGYYDDYNSRHWIQWYKQTRAANAITFDGGAGQGHNDKRFSGAITRFASGSGFDVVTGRAEAAYDGALTRAERTLVYLRPDVIVVHDSLASSRPRSWEWNIHALNRMTVVGPRRVLLRNAPAQMCVEMVLAPEVAFRQFDDFAAPPSGKNMPNQWHGVFASATRSAAAEFIAVMRVGSDCSGKPVDAPVLTANGWTLQVDGRTVRSERGEVSVGGR
jgi:hypothetical protein